MATKRRVLIAFGDELASGDEKRRKLVLSMDANATNNDLAEEIAVTLKRDSESLTLTIAEGFELRPQDGINVIHDGEIVTVTARQSTAVAPLEDHIHRTEPSPIAEPGEPGRMLITLVTASLAKGYASINTTGEATQAGFLAFDGEYISGNTTLRSLREEAARTFDWTSTDDAMDIDEPECHHEKDSACSCAIAQEIEQKGLSTSHHCRFTIDGTHCSHAECPYSHVELNGGTTGLSAPHCSVCTEALGFPCPACINQAQTDNIEPNDIVYCPLVQNAGCGHLHHAHCIGGRHRDRDTRDTGCPSGCPSAKFPKEAAVFDATEPHIVIVWDGDNIDKITIPIPPEGFPQKTSFTLPTDAILSLVREFLSSKSFALPGLSLRIHSRDPRTETVRLTQSTLVSVCPSSTHTNTGYYRFELFGQKPFSSVPLISIPRKKKFHIDFHTSQSPIRACGCTRLGILFPTTAGHPNHITLYIVRRLNEPPEESLKRATVSKELAYLADAAWQPAVLQTRRGMAAMLSSLYMFSHSVAQNKSLVEHEVLAVMYMMTRFPPAVRACILIRNQTPGLEERAALSEALYCAVTDLVSSKSRGTPAAIVETPDRRLEAVRIFLAHVLAEALKTPRGPTDVAVLPVLEEVSLVCAISHKRLVNPVVLDSLVVETSVAKLRLPGGYLYHPTVASHSSLVPTQIQDDRLSGLLSHCGALTSKSVLVLDVNKISVPLACTSPETAGRNFPMAIQRANETDLVIRGPLELKSAGISSPQIVLDDEGLLAVFTGRGCGTTRDVNFFRPINGGDTPVDVNDVSHALQNVILERKSEDTWQIDCFGGFSAAPIRPPDEAIVLCLDLSQSMNKRSGVKRSSADGPDDMAFDYDAEAKNEVQEIVKDASSDLILENAISHLTHQHRSCYQAWKCYLDGDVDASQSDGADHTVTQLVDDLSILVHREVLKLKSSLESHPSTEHEIAMRQLAYFAAACGSHKETLVACLQELLDSFEINDVVGVEPYTIPRNFIDPRTGDLLINPVHPNNAPDQTSFVNIHSQPWFESLDRWPLGIPKSTSLLTKSDQVKDAIARWMSASDILAANETDGDEIMVTLRYEGQETSWSLTTSTTCRTLYCLANRVTQARFSSFTLRLVNSRVPITDSATLTLGLTDLSTGGTIEVSRTSPQRRRMADVTVEDGAMMKPTILLPPDAPILAVLGYLLAWRKCSMSQIMLWYDLTKVGDGINKGTLIEFSSSTTVRDFGYSTVFDCSPWYWTPSGAQRDRENSRHLKRLDLMKELFNIFLNRAASFDTSVSLVLGLVTFSDRASVKQELTPIFENFRQKLDRVSAHGDSAVYDALDLARSVLTNYRRDLPHLRRRIIIVSDGHDTNSESSAVEVCGALQNSRVIVDSVQVGTQSDSTLHAISVATGGYRFSPRTSLSDAFSIFDLETMLSSAERPNRAAKPPVFSAVSLQDYGDTTLYPIDVVTIDRFPKREEHAKLRDNVRPASASINTAQPSDDRTKRIMRELKALVADPHPQVDVYVNDSDMSFFKVIVEAPTDADSQCPYKGGCFLLTCDLPARYPRDPPEIRFVTFILHPNVSKQGKVCIAELGRLWSSDITLKEVFSLIYGLLLEPDLENPLEIQASLKYYDDDGTYALAVATAVSEHASKTRAQWQTELDPE